MTGRGSSPECRSLTSGALNVFIEASSDKKGNTELKRQMHISQKIDERIKSLYIILKSYLLANAICYNSASIFEKTFYKLS